MKGLYLFLIFCAISYNVKAQIETDRPDFTESPNVVPAKALQVETGFIWEQDAFAFNTIGEQKNRNITLNTTLLRYGISNKVELRLNWTAQQQKVLYYNHPLIDPHPSLFDPIRGFSPIFVGAKTNLYSNDKVSIGLLTHLYLPFAASKKYQTKNVAPEFLIPCSIALSDKIGIAFQYGLTWNGETAEPTNSYTLAISAGLTDKLSSYIESYGYFSQTYKDLHLLNGGFTFLINPNFQLDLTGGIGLTENAPDGFVNTGCSFLLFSKQ
jgi:hypothetical protein